MSRLMPGGDESGRSQRWFAATHWSVVLTAAEGHSEAALKALEKLCSAYWYPLYAYVRSQGYSRPDAQDLIQAFFARFLEKGCIREARPDRGRFRSFLLASLRHFMANEWDRVNAEKRGGGKQFISLDDKIGENLYTQKLQHELMPDEIYERTWALTLIEQVRKRLREEFVKGGKVNRFNVLEELLPGENGQLTPVEAASRLGLSDVNLRTELHRLKRRYGELLRREIAHTVDDPTAIDNEIRHLMEVMSR